MFNVSIACWNLCQVVSKSLSMTLFVSLPIKTSTGLLAEHIVRYLWRQKFFLYNYEKFSNNFFKKFISTFVSLTKFKNSFRRNSVTYGTPCDTIGHLSPCYLQDTMPSQWSSSDILPRVLRIGESVLYSQAFFLLVLRPTWDRQFNLNISRTSCWYFQNIASARLFVWIILIHKKIYRLTSI